MTDRQSQEASFANPDLRMIHPASTIMLDETIMGKLRAMTVDEAAVFSPMAILHDDTLEEAAELTLRWEIGALPVIVDDTHLIGIVT